MVASSCAYEVGELKALTLKVLEADKEGKLSFEDAKRIALRMSKKVSDDAALQFEAWADEDESPPQYVQAKGPEASFFKVEETLTSLYVQALPYKRPILLAGGFAACFYGKNFKYSILFSQTFATTGYPSVAPALKELVRSYKRGKKAFKASVDPEMMNPSDDQNSLLLEAAKGVFLAIDPKKVWAVLKASYIGLSASFGAVLSESAAKIGIGMNIGDQVADAINSIFSPLIQKLLIVMRDKALKENSLIDDDTLRSWLDAVVSFLSTCLGVYVAHKVDDLIYLFSACLTGATLAIDNAILLFTKKNKKRSSLRFKHTAIVSLAAYGFFYQRVLGRGHLPFLLRLPLAPLALIETVLASMALSLRANRGG